jgi:hypothetical protein
MDAPKLRAIFESQAQLGCIKPSMEKVKLVARFILAISLSVHAQKSCLSSTFPEFRDNLCRKDCESIIAKDFDLNPFDASLLVSHSRCQCMMTSLTLSGVVLLEGSLSALSSPLSKCPLAHLMLWENGLEALAIEPLLKVLLTGSLSPQGGGKSACTGKSLFCRQQHWG